jgi:hypothetical protein
MSAESQLAGPHAGLMYLVEMQFASATLRFTTWNHNVPALGQTWVGLGAITSVGTISEGERLEYPALEIGLQIADPAQLALALGPANEYRGRPVLLYEWVLDDELRAVEDPQLVWAGLMDQLRLKTGDGKREGAGAVMRCEVPGRDGRGAQSLRLNNAQQQARYPGDTGLSRMERMNGQPQTWLSKRFQKQ